MLFACSDSVPDVKPLQPQTGNITFNVNAPEASFYLPGLQRALSNKAELDVGRYMVEISAPNYVTKRVWIDVYANNKNTIDVVLEKVQVPISLNIKPKLSLLAWSDQSGQAGSLMIEDEQISLAVGLYQLTLTKLGYESETFDLELLPETPYHIDLTLRPKVWAAGEVFADRLKDGSDGPRMVVVAKASFDQGDSVGEGDWRELPVRKVVFDQAYAIGEHEVTVSEFRRFAQSANRIGTLKGDDNMPIASVSWHDAMAYAQWLSDQTGETYRLPTESEWEYAARGGLQGNYGIPELDCDKARYGIPYLCSGEGVVAVKSFPANAFGLYDMHGNVWEWTLDCAADDYSNAPNDGSAYIEDKCFRSSVRGGAYMINAHKLRVSYRSWRYRDYANVDTGFRLVKVLPLPE